jgi:beta-glucosidase-like glycosyl hydrolase
MSNPMNWTKQQIVAQCLFPKLSTEDFFTSPDYKQDILRLVELGVGGFCIFGGNMEQVEQMTNSLQNIAAVPLLFSGDFEFGLPMRLSEGTEFPHAMALGNNLDTDASFKISAAISKEVKSVGIKWNLAPVCDINSNPSNPIINIRSFGENPESVSANIVKFIEGARSVNVLTCAKHFPGHGDTLSDSHIELPAVTKTLEELEGFEIIPFKAAVGAGVDSIMVGHLYVPAMSNNLLPTSLSAKVYSYIRDEMKFKGLIVTDALDMKSITKIRNSADATVDCLLAGADIALMPENAIEAAIALIERAEIDDKLYENCFESSKRIVAAKRKAKLIPLFATLEGTKQIFTDHLNLALNVAYKALQIKVDKQIIPIADDINFAGIAFLQQDKDLRTATRFFTMLSQAIENDCDFAFVNETISDSDLTSIKDGIKDAKILIFAVFIKAVAYDGRTDLITKAKEIFDKLSGGKDTIVIFLGNPYFGEIFDSSVKIWTYSDSFPSLASVVIELSGRKEALKLL